jgi:hypothetical protein
MVIQKGESFNYPKNWSKYKKEIHNLLREANHAYKHKNYITPGLYTHGIKEHPEKYPLLSGINRPLQKRYMSYFLKDQGRVRRGTSTAKSQVWVLPEVFV